MVSPRKRETYKQERTIRRSPRLNGWSLLAVYEVDYIGFDGRSPRLNGWSLLETSPLGQRPEACRSPRLNGWSLLGFRLLQPT